mmetsp:Transcript_5532/g.10680  ORF Transcript_5532/g.10680 Transcript_5532/m.10680 type:complete len:322 (-) Transcript_5532:7-972(-)
MVVTSSSPSRSPSRSTLRLIPIISITVIIIATTRSSQTLRTRTSHCLDIATRLSQNGMRDMHRHIRCCRHSSCHRRFVGFHRIFIGHNGAVVVNVVVIILFSIAFIDIGRAFPTAIISILLIVVENLKFLFFILLFLILFFVVIIVIQLGHTIFSITIIIIVVITGSTPTILVTAIVIVILRFGKRIRHEQGRRNASRGSSGAYGQNHILHSACIPRTHPRQSIRTDQQPLRQSSHSGLRTTRPHSLPRLKQLHDLARSVVFSSVGRTAHVAAAAAGIIVSLVCKIIIRAGIVSMSAGGARALADPRNDRDVSMAPHADEG